MGRLPNALSSSPCSPLAAFTAYNRPRSRRLNLCQHGLELAF
jgi:hypothetical protein